MKVGKIKKYNQPELVRTCNIMDKEKKCKSANSPAGLINVRMLNSGS